MSSPIRRSRRERKVNPRYETSGWTRETIRRLRESDESSNSSSSNESSGDANESDVEFHAAASDENQDRMDLDEEEEDDLSQSEAPEPSSGDETESGAILTVSQTPKRKSVRAGLVATPTTALFTKPKSDKSLRSRGLYGYNDKRKAGKQQVFKINFGPDLEDLRPILAARDNWYLSARDVTFPSRKSLAVFLKGNVDDKAKRAEDVVEGTRAAQIINLDAASQVLTPLSRSDVVSNNFVPAESFHDLVLGPTKSQISYRLKNASTISLGKSWLRNSNASNQSEHLHNNTNSGSTHDSSRHFIPKTRTESASYHTGWLLNVGQKVSCLDWAPNTAKDQYLALSTTPTEVQRQTAGPRPPLLAPAFSPSTCHNSSIQIWRFLGIGNDDALELMLDIKHDPVLSQVICTQIGNIRRLIWMNPLNKPDTALVKSELGSLAILSTDGHVRLLVIPENQNNTTMYHSMERPAVDLPPPENTVFTAMCFASVSDLVVGAANGSVRVFNLLQRYNDETQPIQPHFTHQVHNTYILNVQVANDYPYFLATTAASGETVLLDMRSPHQDRVSVHKARIPTTQLAYAPFTRAFITLVDSAGNSDLEGQTSSTLIAHHLRHFYNTTALARLPESSGIATALAISPIHPCILVANAKGTVFGTNYLRKVIPTARNESHGRNDSYIQKLCEYEWRPADQRTTEGQRPGDQAASTKPLVDIFHGRDARQGVSRFHEGFKVEKVNIAAPATRGKGKKATTTDGGSATIASSKTRVDATAQVIFEEEQAVTAMAWNSNPTCAGWAAIAWGSGIIRVQDLCHDAP